MSIFKALTEGFDKTVGGLRRADEYKRLRDEALGAFRERRYLEGLDTLEFTLYKSHDDIMEFLGVYKGYTDEQLRYRINREKGLTTAILLIDLFELLPQYKPVVKWMRNKLNVTIRRRKVGFGRLPDGFDPVDASSSVIINAMKESFKQIANELKQGQYGRAGIDGAKIVVPAVLEEALGRIGYEGLHLDSVIGWLLADHAQMEREAYPTIPTIYVPTDFERIKYRDPELEDLELSLIGSRLRTRRHRIQ